MALNKLKGMLKRPSEHKKVSPELKTKLTFELFGTYTSKRNYLPYSLQPSCGLQANIDVFTIFTKI